MKKPAIIMIHGKKRSGKGRIADHLVLNHGFICYKFAKPIKNMLCSLLRDAGVPEDEIEQYVEGDLKEDPIEELEGVSARFAMKTLGTDWRNLISADLYANIGARQVAKLLQDGHSVVVEDLRLPQELSALAKWDPALWMVTRPNRDVEDDDHETEWPLAPSLFHARFENSGSLDKLYHEVDQQLRYLGPKNELKDVYHPA